MSVDGGAGIAGGPKWPVLRQVPVRMSVRIPMPQMSLRELAGLRVGSMVRSKWAAAEEVPLFAQNVTLSWCEFEVVAGAIAVRLTRLA